MVVGAGASHELDLPTGEELKAKIAQDLDIRFGDGYRQSSGDYEICSALREAVRRQDGRDINPYLHAAWHIRGALPQAISIDHFLDSHAGKQKVELCGKLGIAQAILKAERRSRIFFEDHPTQSLPINSHSEQWILPFFKMLTQHCRSSELKVRLSQVAVVVFNYDRCIEHYLFHSLKNYYPELSNEEIAEALHCLEIFHPYGSVGELSWQNREAAVDFGEEVGGAKLLDIAGGIKTFTEGTDSGAARDIQATVAGAESLVFLGFAFHPLNMELLFPDLTWRGPRSRQIFATAMGISVYDQLAIKKELAAALTDNDTKGVHLSSLRCCEIFGEYSRGITLK